MKKLLIAWVAILVLTNCSKFEQPKPEASNDDKIIFSIIDEVESISINKNTKLESGLSDVLGLVDQIEKPELRVLSLIYIAAKYRYQGAFVLYEPLHKADLIVAEYGDRVPIYMQLLLARYWILMEMPWKAVEVLEKLNPTFKIVDYNDIGSLTEIEENILNKIKILMCVDVQVSSTTTDQSVSDSSTSSSINTHQQVEGTVANKCSPILNYSKLLSTAKFDDEDFRRYATAFAADNGAIELPSFTESPWRRVLHAPPYSARIGTFFGKVYDDDLTPEERGIGVFASTEAVSASLIDPVPDMRTLARVLSDRMLNSEGEINDPSELLTQPDPQAHTQSVKINTKYLHEIRSVLVNKNEDQAHAILKAIKLPSRASETLANKWVVQAVVGHGFSIASENSDGYSVLFCSDISRNECLFIETYVPPKNGLTTFFLQDLNGDNEPELLYQMRQGASSRLYIGLFSGVNEKPALDRFVPHGQLVIQDIDLDGDLDILVKGVDKRISVDCNQCPGVLATELYQISEDKRGQFEFVGSFGTQSETEVLTGTGGGIYSINSDRQREALLQAAGASLNGKTNVLEKLLKDPNEYEKLRKNLFPYLRTLEKRGDYDSGLDAIAYAEAIIVPINRNHDPELLAAWKARFLLSGGQVNSARNILQKIITSCKKKCPPELSKDILTLKIDLALIENRYSDIRKLIDESKGMISVGDKLSSYFIALGEKKGTNALINYVNTSLSTEETDASAIDALIGLSELSRDSDRVAAFDYLFLAARWCRTLETSKCVRVSDAALKIFDKDNLEINTLFARDMLASIGPNASHADQIKLSLSLIRSTHPLSKEYISTIERAFAKSKIALPDTALSIAQLLSEEYEKEGDVEAALRWSTEGIHVLDNGRRRFATFTEQIKFLHREKQYDRHLRLLEKSKAGASQFLLAVESFKYQILRDSVNLSKDHNDITDIDQTSLVKYFSDRLEPGEIYVSFFFGANSGYGLLVSSDGKPEVRRLQTDYATCSRVSQQVLKRFSLNNEESVQEFRKDNLSQFTRERLRAAGKLFLDDLKLPSNIHTIYISGDGCQSGLPWSALVLDDNHFAVERFSVATVIPLRQPLYDNKGSGNIVINAAHTATRWVNEQPPQPELADLPALNSNTEEIAQVLGEQGYSLVKMFLNGYDLGSGLPVPIDKQLTAFETASVVHISSHGYFDTQDTGRSILVFNDGSYSRSVSADDLSRLDLHNVRLIVIAACESGSLLAQPASEPVGFVRSAIGAGANAGVFANWQVDDAASDKLLRDFYKNITVSKYTRSLQNAQLKLKSQRHHPYFWAGFSFVQRF
jgi:CHAT domain-containing protein